MYYRDEEFARKITATATLDRKLISNQIRKCNYKFILFYTLNVKYIYIRYHKVHGENFF